MHEECTKWIEAPTHHVTLAGTVKPPTNSNVCEWVKNSWQQVKSETIVKSLKKCGISNALDGSEDDILYEESEASSEKTMKNIIVAVKMFFWFSMMNKSYYCCYFGI